MSDRIQISIVNVPEGGGFNYWSACLDVDGSPHSDGQGPTQLLALANLAESLAEQLLDESAKEAAS